MKVWTGLLVMVVLMAGGCTQTTTATKRKPQPNVNPAEINVELGIAYMQNGMKVVAMEKLQKALDQDPTLPKAHTAIAVLYENLGETEQADTHFRRALQLDPKNSPAHNNYGGFLCRHDRGDEAMKHFEAAAMNPLYERPELAWANAGLCTLRTSKDEATAERYFRKSLQANAFFPVALLNMAKLSLNQGQYLKTRAYLQRYQEVAKHTPESLWIGIQAEQQLGDRNAVSSYGLLLKNNFPESPQTQQWLEQQANGTKPGR